MFLRSADLEARALFLPGGLYGSVRDTLGPQPAKFAASALLVDRLTLGPLAAVVAGQYAVAVGHAIAGSPPAGLGGGTPPIAVAAALIASVWWLQRQGRAPSDCGVSRAVGLAIAALGVLVVWAFATSGVRHVRLPLLPLPPDVNLLWLAAALGYALPGLGGVDALGLAALDLEQPRIRNLLRVARLVGAYTLFITAATAFLVVGLVPEGQRRVGLGAAGRRRDDARGAGVVACHDAALVSGAAIVFLAATLRAAAIGGHGTLARLVDEGMLGEELRAHHHRFGTPWRIIDTTAVAHFVMLLASNGDVLWLARMYAFAVVCGAILKVAALSATASVAGKSVRIACP